GIFFDNVLSDLFLAPKGIDGDNTASNIERVNQFRDGCYLVRFLGHLQLTEHQTIGGCPGAHHMNGRLIEFGIIRVTQGFAVNRHNFSAAKVAELLHPAQKTRLEVMWVNPRQHTTNRIMRWYSIWQREKGFQPVILFVTVFFDVRGTISTTDN